MGLSSSGAAPMGTTARQTNQMKNPAACTDQKKYGKGRLIVEAAKRPVNPEVSR